MDKLNCIKLFTCIARLGSFTRTADDLNMTQGAVSKRIAWLENELGFKLFHRTSRKISLTSAGEEYLSYCHVLIEQMTHTEQRLKNELSKVVGNLKISVPTAFATQKLAAPLGKFLSLYPDVTVNISVNDKLVDLYRDDIDIAIRASHLKDSGLKAKKLLEHELCYFASPGYLKQYGTPINVRDIKEHSCITYSLSNPSNIWLLNNEKFVVREAISSDSPEMIVSMALLGHGIAAMPKWMVQGNIENNELIEIYSDLPKSSLPMYAVYKSSEHLPFRIRAFIDFLTDYFQRSTLVSD
ncbi:LysR family transcriptional regulator [Cognaticolwellia mytili]|uniref:LysR family transcriptional regulator n=1 Tax=Cognaticolwellia mytili TaxID=1888913 RepID=UPI000A1765E0|nr:LysR family transcriptional regulator [Cognaticolwellia mytili]